MIDVIGSSDGIFVMWHILQVLSATISEVRATGEVKPMSEFHLNVLPTYAGFRLASGHGCGLLTLGRL